jgi:hypothetical protein
MTGDEGSSLDKRQLSGMELRVLQQITARRAVLKMLGGWSFGDCVTIIDVQAL